MTKTSIDPSDFDGARMPTRSIDAKSAPRTIDALLHDLDQFDEDKAKSSYPWTDRFVMGLPLPSWQREFKWSDEQCQRFITSAWTGVHLGNYVVNREEPQSGPNGELVFDSVSNIVIDGQQRLMALQRYVLDEIAVPDAEGILRYFSEVSAAEKRRFGNVVFTRSEIDLSDENELCQFYDLLNFGGISHTPEERAVKGPRP